MKLIYFFLSIGVISNSLLAMEQSPSQGPVKPPISQRLNIVGPLFAAYMRDNGSFIVGTSTETKNQIYVTDTQTYATKWVADLASTDTNVSDVSPDSKHVLAYSEDSLTVWDIETKKTVTFLGITTDPVGAVYNKVGDQLLISEANGALIFDLRSNKVSLENNELIWPALTPNPVENNTISALTCLTGHYPHKLLICDSALIELCSLASFDLETTTNAQWSNDGKSLVVGGAGQLIECESNSGSLTYYNLQGKKVGNKPIKITEENRGSWPLNINFMPGDAKRFFSGTTMNTLIYCDLEDDAQSFSFKSQSGGNDAIEAVAIDPNGNCLAAGNFGDSGNQSLIQLWDISNINEQKQAALNKAKAEAKNAQKNF